MDEASAVSGSAVTLRDVTDPDLEVFFEHQLDPEASRMAAFPSRDREAHLAHWRDKVLAGGTSIARTVVHGSIVAGNVVSWVQDGHREIGYWIGRDHWGKGIATAAVAQFLEVVDERPLFAYVAAHNAGSARVLEKCGFTFDREVPEDDVTLLAYVLR